MEVFYALQSMPTVYIVTFTIVQFTLYRCINVYMFFYVINTILYYHMETNCIVLCWTTLKIGIAECIVIPGLIKDIKKIEELGYQIVCSNKIGRQ